LFIKNKAVQSPWETKLYFTAARLSIIGFSKLLEPVVEDNEHGCLEGVWSKAKYIGLDI
jgi:hypothetical protein